MCLPKSQQEDLLYNVSDKKINGPEKEDLKAMYISPLTYLARNDLLSCVFPVAFSRFSLSIFWMYVCVSGLQENNNYYVGLTDKCVNNY